MMKENMLPVGTLLRGGTYQITKQLSRGGFGNTYVVQNVSFNETYAMKEFFMKGVNLRVDGEVTVSVSDNKGTFESQKNKLKKEAQRLRKLHNRHIVQVHDLFEENGTVYYVMDYIDGESLDERLKRTKQPLAEAEALDYMRQVLEALQVVHRQQPQLLHLDIKPANIMVDRQGCAYLIDFGASKQLSADESNTLSTSSGMSYTAGYAPSEQIERNYERMGPWTDYYALGATLYRLLTMQQPPSPSEIDEDADEAFRFPATVSDSTQKLIRWMMAPNRKKRPQTVEEMLNFLDSHPLQRKDGAEEEETVYEQKKPAENSETTEFEKDHHDHEPKSKPWWKSLPQSAKWIALSVVLVVVVLVLGSRAFSSEKQKQILDGLIANMVYVEGGTFTMGATSEQGNEDNSDEKPAHQVTLSSFSIGKYEVTQEEWKAVMGSNPSEFKGAKRPVECVSWDDCQEFIRKLNALTGKRFRLPTEAEWEYAARGGNRSQGYKYAGGNSIVSVAWFDGNAGNETHPVGQKQSNELGLYDMAGNVYEWCQDWYGDYSSSPQTNPTGPSSAIGRVFRGGCWRWDAGGCRVSSRNTLSPDIYGHILGLRLAL
jgi:formylglycine-generating enzyme required for sulfatase activity